MAIEVTIQELEPQTTLGIRETCRQSELPATMDRIFGELWAYLERVGQQPAGPAFTRYYAETPDSFSFEAGFPLAEPVPCEGRMGLGELPGGRAAVTTHVGPYEGLAQVYPALEAWIEQQGHTANGAPWEVYVTDPSQEPDSSKWRTDLIWPIR